MTATTNDQRPRTNLVMWFQNAYILNREHLIIDIFQNHYTLPLQCCTKHYINCCKFIDDSSVFICDEN